MSTHPSPAALLTAVVLTGCGRESPGPDGLYGTRPLEPTSAPTFTVTNRDGAARTRDDLLGAPSVVWFYPAAATSG